jgi:3-isopropylmalate/(R)-2-methylmalate dehydratase small subunit
MKGKIWKYGDNVNTDVIYAGKYTYQQLKPEEMAAKALEDLDPAFAKGVKPGDIIVAGKNFGCGSSREQAAACLRAAGVQAVVAKSFARIYFRNAINLGLPVIQCEEAADALAAGDEAEIDFAGGRILAKGRAFTFPPLPASVLGILEAGGLIEWTKKKLAAK